MGKSNRSVAIWVKFQTTLTKAHPREPELKMVDLQPISRMRTAGPCKRDHGWPLHCPSGTLHLQRGENSQPQDTRPLKDWRELIWNSTNRRSEHGMNAQRLKACRKFRIRESQDSSRLHSHNGLGFRFLCPRCHCLTKKGSNDDSSSLRKKRIRRSP